MAKKAAKISSINDTMTAPRAQCARQRGKRLTKAEREASQETFLDAFAEEANVSAACKRAGIARNTLYQWQEHDEAFSLRYHDAEKRAQDVIRAAIHEHAIRGWDEYVVSMGKVVFVDGKPLTQHKYDSSLLARLATAHLPEFRQQQDVNIHGSLDITTLAAEADARFHTFLTATTTTSVLEQPDTRSEG